MCDLLQQVYIGNDLKKSKNERKLEATDTHYTHVSKRSHPRYALTFGFLFCRVGSIHAASCNKNALSAGPDFLGAVGILHATTHETSHLAKERPSQGDATPNHTAGSFFIETRTSCTHTRVNKHRVHTHAHNVMNNNAHARLHTRTHARR
jgi:hypothetical protein